MPCGNKIAYVHRILSIFESNNLCKNSYFDINYCLWTHSGFKWSVFLSWRVLINNSSRILPECHQNTTIGTSLVAQWLRIRLPMQGTQVQSLVREDTTCHGTTKPMRHNYWGPHTLDPTHHNYWARVLQLLKSACLEPVLRNKRSHQNEKPTYHNEE